MILFDTSIWIEFLRRHEPYSTHGTTLLEQGKVLGVECVFGELLQGARNKRERTILLEYWQALPKMSSDGLFIEAGLHSGKADLLRHGVGLIDSVIIQHARHLGALIWTLDKKLKKICEPAELYNMTE